MILEKERDKDMNQSNKLIIQLAATALLFFNTSSLCGYF